MEEINKREYRDSELVYFNTKNVCLTPYIEYQSGFTLYCIDINNKTAGIEFCFNYENRSISYYKDKINESLEVAFKEHTLNKVFVNVIRDNYRLYNILRSFNFITEAIHREQYYNQKPHDVIFMTILKGEWEKAGIQYKYDYNKYRNSISNGEER